MKASKYIISVFAAAVACVELSAAVPEKKDTVITYPWGQKLTYWQTTGSGLSVNIPKLETKVAGDLRNRMTGVVPGMDVRERWFRPVRICDVHDEQQPYPADDEGQQ